MLACGPEGSERSRCLQDALRADHQPERTLHVEYGSGSTPDRHNDGVRLQDGLVNIVGLWAISLTALL